MSWIAADADLPEKPKVRQMARYLGLDRWSISGRLICVWAWFDKASTDGVIAGAVAADIDDLAGHDGFADAMQMVGWLAIDGSGVCIPDFEDHHGNSAKKRALGALRQARYRERKSNAATITDNANDVTESSTEPQDDDVLVTRVSLPQNITEDNKKKEQEPRAGENEKPAEPTAAGLACKALMAEGIAHVNPSHPDLLAALTEGATPAEFTATARECVARGKRSFAYVLAVIRKRKAETAAPVKQPEATPRKFHRAANQQSRSDPVRLGAHLADIAAQLGIKAAS